MPSPTSKRSLEEIQEILEWAHARGALKVTVGDVDILFPHPDTRASAEYEEEGFKDAPTIPPVYRSPLDDPDYYASEFDSWKSYTPPAK